MFTVRPPAHFEHERQVRAASETTGIFYPLLNDVPFNTSSSFRSYFRGTKADKVDLDLEISCSESIFITFSFAFVQLGK